MNKNKGINDVVGSSAESIMNKILKVDPDIKYLIEDIAHKIYNRSGLDLKQREMKAPIVFECFKRVRN
ncbi:hypothetical protein DY120_06440 [Apilactobacillus micheneri]|uniref:Uncharacterized protein n=1 Tax=Apilactobacillus micheneri TaxID=1899430 RepID=A0ABY2YVL4_9LACO|nr:hypothetical protein [Apilactobacillus micheneri]TPR24289.1 hypothetical protein DY114_06440 [Apilactobacillus micheneri]TPR25308.1 hypothetical protein DY111_06440 [Apilactobacillus micheneri]TPR27620.1 hypothetical protein DY113_05540 [Apilactobacillus micheneri]TPR28885.1 hypothetical protein DY117_06440 [Apilactobacillus micheneri]TPR29907.1 hypothetical protein DY120_06440 [Apilactobacillus micheneri]